MAFYVYTGTGELTVHDKMLRPPKSEDDVAEIPDNIGIDLSNEPLERFDSKEGAQAFIRKNHKGAGDRVPGKDAI